MGSVLSTATAAPRPARVAVLRDAGFPTVDGTSIANDTLDRALAGIATTFLKVEAVNKTRLRRSDFDVLVLPYGSAFPVEGWPAIREFAREGGSMVVLGGAPFYQPVRKENGAWKLGPRQPTFAHELFLGPADAVDLSTFKGPLVSRPLIESEWQTATTVPRKAWALTLRLASQQDFPSEGGSAGPRDGVVRPLVHIVDGNDLPRVCPLLEIDRLRGNEAGGRWIFAPSDAPLDAATIRALIVRALEGAAEVDARPVRAAIDSGEPAVVRISVRRPMPRPGEVAASKARFVVRDEAGSELSRGEASLTGTAEFRSGEIKIQPDRAWTPGLYRVAVILPGAPFHPQSTVTGFWVKDQRLLQSGSHLSVSRDWIRANQAVLPVVGTTYMASDVHRKFLFEPNPALWERDFAQMQRQGINFVRTGLWTGWTRAMLDSGAVDDNVLSALDAFVLTAAKHGIHVCFNFFAFLPPAHGDANPYLGPRAKEGQRAFLATIARRYRGVNWVHWDLINEPSYAPPTGVWRNLPIGDVYEASAWREWVKAKHGDNPNVLRELWREPGDDVWSVPAADELEYNTLREHRRPRKARDFQEFTQWLVARWASELRDVLRATGGDALVTLGQDEGGTRTRPAQLLHAGSVDYTSVHTWWGNDDLLWDGVMTKSLNKPNLHQETGLTSLEDIDGEPWRTPLSAANLLERKFAYAFASRGAGVVEWAWNINPYQPIDNEATIGLFRPDGTAKPELDRLSEMAAFFAQAAPLLDDFAPDKVALIVPYSRLFTGRPAGLDATKRVLRLLAEDFGVVPQALSEIGLRPEQLQNVKLAIVPSPEMLQEEASAALLAASKAGTKILITGQIDGDSYGRPTPSLRALGVLTDGVPVALHESTVWAGGQGKVTFENLAQQWLRKSTRTESRSFSGNVWHEPLPLEFARETEPLSALLALALETAGIETSPGRGGVTARALVGPRASLVVCINESSVPAVREVRVDGRWFRVPVPALRARLALIDKAGRVVVATAGQPISTR